MALSLSIDRFRPITPAAAQPIKKITLAFVLNQYESRDPSFNQVSDIVRLDPWLGFVGYYLRRVVRHSDHAREQLRYLKQPKMRKFLAERPVVHVEMRFEDTGEVTSLTGTLPVFIHKKALQRNGYTFLEFDVTSQQQTQMKEFATRCRDAKVSLDNSAVLRSWLPFNLHRKTPDQPKELYCAEYLTLLLQHGGKMMDHVPAKASPMSILSAMKPVSRAAVNSYTVNQLLNSHAKLSTNFDSGSIV